MEHFVVINDWSNEYESGVTVLGVIHTLEEAKEIFNNSIKDEKNYAKENGFKIYTDSETEFDAGKDGFYATEHTRLYIQKIQ